MLLSVQHMSLFCFLSWQPSHITSIIETSKACLGHCFQFFCRPSELTWITVLKQSLWGRLSGAPQCAPNTILFKKSIRGHRSSSHFSIFFLLSCSSVRTTEIRSENAFYCFCNRQYVADSWYLPGQWLIISMMQVISDAINLFLVGALIPPFISSGVLSVCSYSFFINLV